MRIVIFTHPTFVLSQSMPRLARMIAEGMRARGHLVDEWTAQPLFSRLPFPVGFKKWLGYVDQFVVFPLCVNWRLRRQRVETLFVFCDQALAPWVPLVRRRPHVLHVNDLLAVRSALGEFSENAVGWTGRKYQTLIHHGLTQAQRFVSISKKTRADLHRLVAEKPKRSEVVYLGLNFPFRPMRSEECKAALSPRRLELPSDGFLLHVGGNQWYKNRGGVLEIYEAYVRDTERPLPLWLVGASPTPAMKDVAARVAPKGDVRFLTELSDEQVCAAYSSARLLLFPSLAEGFGWPIAEAMACGCLVLTSAEAPMTEVGGDAAFYVPTKPTRGPETWATNTALRVTEILSLTAEEAERRRNAGYKQVAQFDSKFTLDAYERIYTEALAGGVH